MDRTILHVDCDKYYASVEVLHHPEARGRPVVVGGDEEQRHGIVLTRNEIAAQKYGIKTGETLWQARRKCPGLIVYPPRYPLYIRFSGLVREILLEYTDRVEPYGIDESWIDITGSNGERAAREIQRRIWRELGITVSIGVAWNKVYAKLGSDYNKPHGITVINRSNYKGLVYPLPASDLLYVGRATARKLRSNGILTIGDIAQAPDHYLHMLLGKRGIILRRFAAGHDNAPVAKYDADIPVKSIGNSVTAPRDLICDEDVKMVMIVLAESVARKLRELGYKGRTVQISVRDNQLYTYTRQITLGYYIDLCGEIVQRAMELLRDSYAWERPIRSVGVNVSDFAHDDDCVQLDLYGNHARREKSERLERAIDRLKARYGNYVVQRATLLADRALTQFDPYDDHTIHPVGYF